MTDPDDSGSRIDIVSAADYDGQLPPGWERFRGDGWEGCTGLGRYRWYCDKCYWVAWDYVVTIGDHPVGALGWYFDRDGNTDCYQINWGLRIPPTRFNNQDDALTFAPLFVERHGDRLLRAIRSPKSATHMLQDRLHTKPYELGASLYYSFSDDHENSDFAWVLDKRGDRIELLFSRRAEPVIARKGTEHSSMLWGAYERDGRRNPDDVELHESAQCKANQRRSEHARARQRKPDGCFVRVGTATTTEPDRLRDNGTGSDVGAL